MTEQRPNPKVTVIPATKQQEQSHHGGRNLRVAAYCRVSSKKDEQEHSFEVQKAYYTEKITKNPEWKIAGIYADEGITGTSMKKRDDFKRMLRACREGRIDLILVKSVARFGRNTVDTMKTVRSLQERNIGVIFEEQGLDTRTMNSELLIAFFAAFSQSESESIRENVTWGYRKSFEMGKVSVHKNTFGFTKLENKDIAIDEEQAAAMQLMFDLCLDGVSFYGIKQELEKRGIKNPTGGSVWSVSTIRAILQNEKCKGDALLQKTYRPTLFSKRVANDGVLPKYYVSNCLPQIIKPEIFDRVQAEIGRRQSKRPATDKAKNPYQGKHSGKYALSSLMFCANCGAPYRRVTWTIHGKKKIVWRCVSRLDHGKAMENQKTLAFQVSEDFFYRIKDYLRRNNMTQKQFVIGLIEDELERDEALLQGNGEEEPAGEEDPEEAPVEQGEDEPNPTISSSGSEDDYDPEGIEAEEDFADETPNVSADDFEIDGDGNEGEEEGQDYGPEM